MHYMTVTRIEHRCDSLDTRAFRGKEKEKRERKSDDEAVTR